MQTETFIEPKAEASAKLRLFSLYVDFDASIHVRWANNKITKLAGSRWKIFSEIWALDSCDTGPAVRTIMLQHAADADVLIIALSSLDQRQPKLIEWLNTLAEQRAELPVSGLFIGLLGDEDHEAGELGWTVKQFIVCAQRMGMDFIWHWMGREAIDDNTWLADNVQKSLSRKRSQLSMVGCQAAAAGIGRLPAAV